MGPIEVVVVNFPDSGRVAGIAPLLQDLVDAGHVRIADALIVTRGAAGRMVVSEPDESVIPNWSSLSSRVQPLLSADDATLVAEEIGPGGAAVIVVIEHTWPDMLARLAGDSGGLVSLHTRVDTVTVEEATRINA